MSGDTLARGGFRAVWGPVPVSQEKWDSIFGPKDSAPSEGSCLAELDKPSGICANPGSVPPPNNQVGHGRRGRRAKMTHQRGKKSQMNLVGDGNPD